MTAQRHTFFPREHGATAMLLTPFAAVAILARTIRWQEAAAVVTVVVAFAMKDPLVVLARQWWVWKQPHPETPTAIRWVAAETAVVAICGLALVASGSWVHYAVLFCGAAMFLVLAVWVNMRNRQRATIFQVASAVALTSTSLVAALAATDKTPGWCWRLWGLLAAQAAAGIFTVHARLDARVAARKAGGSENVSASRRSALVIDALLAVGGVVATLAGNYWIGGALLLVAAVCGWDLRQQLDPGSLQMPLRIVGIQNLSLSLLYAAMLVAAFW